MRRPKQLFLLITAVAGVLVLAALHDWWNNQYEAESSYGRGIRRLSEFVTVNTTTKQKSVVSVPTTTRKTELSSTKVLQLSKPHVPATKKKVIKTKVITVKKIITKAVHRSNSSAPRVLGPHINLNSSAAHLFISNAILKSRPMKIIEKDKVTRILLVTYFRGGSTFLGDLLQQNWKTFYHFEPLHYMSFASRVTTKEQIRDAFNVISQLYRCNFDSLTHYTKWVTKKKNQFLIKRNHFLWSLCHIHPYLCFMPYYMTQICVRAPIQIMKVTRLYLRDALEFMKENSDLKIKLIFLSRDPRGIFSSRRVLDWCKKEKCASPEGVCKDIASDVEYLRNNSTSFMWLRYEDMCLDPNNITKSLYKWLGIPYTIGVANFLRSHTKAKKIYADNPYSTHRNTTTVAFEWLHRLSFPEIEHVQYQCRDVMRALRYKVIENNVTYYERDIPDSVIDVIPQTDGVSVFRS